MRKSDITMISVFALYIGVAVAGYFTLVKTNEFLYTSLGFAVAMILWWSVVRFMPKTTKVCPNCGVEQRSKSKFCGGCGNPL